MAEPKPSPYAWVNKTREIAAKIRKKPQTPSNVKKTTKTGGLDKYMKDNLEQKFIKNSREKEPAKEFSKEMDGLRSYNTELRKIYPKKSAPTTAQKRAAAKKAVVPTAKKSVPVSSVKAPTAKGVTVGKRTYTDKEKQINALLMTGKKKNGTMKASAQRKIQKIRTSK